MPHRPVPAQRIERQTQQCAGHGDQFNQGQRQWISDQDIKAEFVEVGGHERCRRQSGKEGRHQQGTQPSGATVDSALWWWFEALWALYAWLMGWRAVMHRYMRLVHRNQSRHGGKGKLKSRAQQSLRLQQYHGHCREGEIAHGQGLPVKDNRAKHDERHDQSPLGANPRAGKAIVSNSSRHGEARRPFADRPLQSQRRTEAQKAAHQPEQQARDETHLDSRNGYKVKNSRFADNLANALIEHAALARDHRHRHSTAFAGNGPQNIARHPISQSIQRHAEALGCRGTKGRIKHLNASKDRSNGTKSGKIRVGGEIITSRQHGMRGGQKACFEGDKVARLRARSSPHGDTHLSWTMGPDQRIGAGYSYHETRTRWTRIDAQNIARNFDNADVVQHRRANAIFAQLHSCDPGKKQHQTAERPSAPGMVACQQSQKGEYGGQRRRIPTDRLARCPEFGQCTKPRHGWCPEEHAATVDLSLKTGGECKSAGGDPSGSWPSLAEWQPRETKARRPRWSPACLWLHFQHPTTPLQVFAGDRFTLSALMIHEGAAGTRARCRSRSSFGHNMTLPIVTRFAPSPTGFLHIGGARTALFNWLYARHQGGRFLLRIEDTDRERSTDAAVAAIFEGLKWLGLESDGPPVMQFSRAARHREVAEALLTAGHAYKCFATAAELDDMRAIARAEGRAPRYDGRWRDKDSSEAPAGARPVLRLKAPQTGETVIRDKVQGDVTFANKDLDDLVLLRSDGTPTYMLAVVVDDHDMGVTDIIRGDDHLTNAARQAQIYAALQWDLPRMAHIPLIHGADGAKLSKRHGALGVEAYRDMGFLPAALRNYLLRLGWSAGDKEFFTTDEMIAAFSLEQIGRSAARFDFVKLGHVNGHYLRTMPDAELMKSIKDLISQLPNCGLFAAALNDGLGSRLQLALPGLKERARTLVELLDNARFLYAPRPLPLDARAAALLSTPPMRNQIAECHALLTGIEDWSAGTTEAAMRLYAEGKDLKLGAVAQPLRAALTGTLVSPGVFDVLAALGRTESLARLQDQIA